MVAVRVGLAHDDAEIYRVALLVQAPAHDLVDESILLNVDAGGQEMHTSWYGADRV